MVKQALALALIGTASLACSEVEPERVAAADQNIGTQDIGPGVVCMTPSTGEALHGGTNGQSFARVTFSESARGDVARVERYDAATGFVIDVEELLYKKTLLGEVTLYESSTMRHAPSFRLKMKNGEVQWADMEPFTEWTATCEEGAAAASFALPVAQSPAAAEPVTGDEPPTLSTDEGAVHGCVATTLVDGRVLRLAFRRDREHPYGRAELYDPTTHFLAEDLLEGAWASLDATDDGLVIRGNSMFEGHRVVYGKIQPKAIDGVLQLVLVPDPVFLHTLPADIPLDCDL